MARQNRLNKYSENPVTEENVDQEEKTLGQKWNKKQKQKTMEETHMRTSFLFKRELRDRLDRLSSYYGRGYRTEFLNHFIEKGILAEEERMRKEIEGEQ